MSDKVSLKELAQAERAQMERQQSGEVPDVSVPLPSRGKVYPTDNVLFLAETVDVRAMTAKDENILSSMALIKKGTALTSVMRACMTNKLIDVDSMLVGDRNAVLIGIRNSSYGSEYTVDVDCPSCDAKFEHTFDMSRLSVKTLDVEPCVSNTNNFRFDLPRTKREVIFRLLTGRDVAELDRTQAQRKKNNVVVDDSATLSLHHQIISIGGEEDRNKLMKLVETMPAYDSLALRTYIADIIPGVDMIQDMSCPVCDAVSEVDVPMGTEFFWPTGKRRKRR